MLDSAKCNKILHSYEFSTKIADLKKIRPDLQAYVVAELDDLLSSQAKHYAYDKSWAEARRDPILVAHSSGSTGKSLSSHSFPCHKYLTLAYRKPQANYFV